ncbi:MAG TPA: MBL fold metallo-hydrolase [Steroidobacteraceae bacterium]|nr:MBL fold metallo-hydrolase [Steroidobacteraceae bacterium]
MARIVEINAFEDDIAMLLPDGKPEFVQQFKWLQPHFATPDGRMILSFQAFVLRSQGKSVMIDTCIGADRKREYDVFCNLQSTFLEDLASAGFPPAEIDAVLCTHLHFDHVGWNTRLVNGKWVPTFPQARYLFGRREWQHWKHLRDTGGYHHMDHVEDAIDPVMEAGLVDFIDPDYKVTDEVSLIPTPGHTPGHVSVLIQSQGQQAVITGDLMHHPIQLAAPEIHGNFDMDKAQGAQTRKTFIERFADTGALIIGSHFSDPTAGKIVRDGKSWKLATE